MQRRDFLKTCLASAAAIVVNPVPSLEARPLGLMRLPACQLAIYGSSAYPHPFRKLPKISEPPAGILLASLRMVPRDASPKYVRLEAARAATALASGDPLYFRLVHLGETIIQGTCGVFDGDLKFNSMIILGGEVAINYFEIRRI